MTFTATEPTAGDPVRRVTLWTYDACLDGLVIALGQHKGKKLGQRDLNALAAKDRRIPRYSRLHGAMKREGKEGGLSRAIRDAEERRRERADAGSSDA